MRLRRDDWDPFVVDYVVVVIESQKIESWQSSTMACGESVNKVMTS